MMRRVEKNLAMLAAGLALLLCAHSVANAAVSGTFTSVVSGSGTAVRLDGSPALGAFRGGLLHWTQNAPSTSYAPMPMRDAANGSTSFSSTSFVSVGVGMTLDLPSGVIATYQTGALTSQVGQVAADYIAQLWHNHIGDLAGNKPSSSMSFKSLKVFQDPNRNSIGAFQIAVWKLVSDQGLNFDLASGRLTADPGAERQLAQTWLNELAVQGIGGAKANLFALRSSGVLPVYQIVELQPGITPLVAEQPLPEPGTIVIWGVLGALGVGVGRRRKQTAGDRGGFSRRKAGENYF